MPSGRAAVTTSGTAISVAGGGTSQAATSSQFPAVRTPHRSRGAVLWLVHAEPDSPPVLAGTAGHHDLRAELGPGGSSPWGGGALFPRRRKAPRGGRRGSRRPKAVTAAGRVRRRASRGERAAPSPVVAVLETGTSARHDGDRPGHDDQPEFFAGRGYGRPSRFRSRWRASAGARSAWCHGAVLSPGHRTAAGRVHRARRDRDRERGGARGAAPHRGRAGPRCGRVATLVARGVGPALVFAAIAEEVGTQIGARRNGTHALRVRRGATFLGGHGWSAPDGPGMRFTPAAGSAMAVVRETCRAARRDTDDLTSTGFRWMPRLRPCAASWRLRSRSRADSGER